MRRRTRIAAASLGALCLLSACSKLGQDGFVYWNGEYIVKMTSNTDGSVTERKGTMTLYFRNDGTECVIQTGIEGLYAVNRVTYATTWDSQTDFLLSQKEDPKMTPVFRGTIENDKLILRGCSGTTNMLPTYILHKRK